MVGVVPHRTTSQTTNATGFSAPISKSQSQSEIRKSRLDPYRSFNFPTFQLHLNHFLVLEVVELGSRTATHEDHVVPGDFGDGVRPLLHPTVVVETTVVHAGVSMKDHFESLLGGLSRLRFICDGLPNLRCQLAPVRSLGTYGDWLGLQGCVVPIVQTLFPLSFKVRRTRECFQGRPRNVIALGFCVACQTSEKLNFAPTPKEGRDQRLNREPGTLSRTIVSPGLQVVSHGQVPVHILRGFINIVAQAYDVLSLALTGLPIQIRRRVVNRVAIQDDQCFHFACIARGFEGFER